MLRLAVDDRFTAYLNGQRVGSGADWMAGSEFAAVARLLHPGRNVLAVRAENAPGPKNANPAGLNVVLEVTLAGGEKLVVRSDAYELTGDAEMRLVRDEPPLVDLDSQHYKLIRDFDAHFPAGPPSLKECDRPTVEGDVVFGADVVVRGSVAIEGDQRIEDGAVLEG